VGTGLKHLQKPLLKKRPVFLPSENVLSKFQDIVRPMLTLQSDKRRENASLQELRDWLLPMLMNGQVKFGRDGKLSFV
jgi:type I restriction enzyme S subunit